ncbi:hypothetical protein [Okeania sp.]|uniref:hypothetical protein n=1 Tax=Okeania sp. TaxID=3100323 RepID=UPI002B4AC5B1|nr:hypothetical protein [Okeania sp.]MEB3341040.1 hypothetical protein [Okeania sp.]
MEETQNSELFSNLSTEKSATINGGHYYNNYGYGRSVYYYNRPIINHHYRSYNHRYNRPISYSYQRNYNCY